MLTNEESIRFVKELEDRGFDLDDYEFLVNKSLTQGFMSGVEALRLTQYEDIIDNVSEEFELNK